MLDHWCIESLLETDLYKFNMDNLYFTQYSDYTAKWAYKCRNRKDGSVVQFTKEDVAEINRQIDHLCTLTFSREELNLLFSKATWLTPSFMHFLSMFRLDRDEIRVTYDESTPSHMTIEAGGDSDPLMRNLLRNLRPGYRQRSLFLQPQQEPCRTRSGSYPSNRPED